MEVDISFFRSNDYRAKTIIVSEIICIDKSISRWYGQRRYWINAWLSNYVDIDRKLENGGGVSGIMTKLKVAKEESDYSSTDTDEEIVV